MKVNRPSISPALRSLFEKTIVSSSVAGFEISRVEQAAALRFVARYQEDLGYRDAMNTHWGEHIGVLNNRLDAEVVRPPLGQEYDGIAWLLQNRRKLLLGTVELRCLLSEPSFRLVRFEVKHVGLYWRAGCVWKVQSKRGSFCYVAWPWQSNIQPSLV